MRPSAIALPETGLRAPAAEAARAARGRAVLATDYAAWPFAARRLALAPLEERRITLATLAAFLDGAAAGSGWTAPDLGTPLFPKIAVASWKCFPWIAPTPVGFDLGRFCSSRMRAVLAHWLQAGVEPVLRFFPFVDFSRVDEFRFVVRRDDAALVRRTVRGDVADGLRRARALIEDIADEFDDVRVDVAVPARGRPWLVEINPPQRKSHA